MLYHSIIVFCLVLFKGLFTAFSTGIRVLELKKAKYIADCEDVIQQRLNKALDKIDIYNNVAGVVNALVGLIIGIYVALFIYPDMESYLTSVNALNGSVWADYIGLVLIICLATYMFSFFSIVVPKFIADRYPDVVVLKLNGLIKIFQVILFPLVWLVDISYTIIEKILSNKDEGKDEVSEEEILMMVDAGGETGGIDEHEMEMINNIFEFDDKTVGEIATHRKNIVALPKTATISDIKNIVLEEKYSRIPVYDENIDNIIGVIHIKDMFQQLLSEGSNSFNINEIMRKPEFVPFNMKTDTLFEDMQRKKFHIAIVVDEYGGTAGIITMEDLIEEIMGNIQDEYDEEEIPEISVLDDDSMLIDGTTSLDDVAEQLEIELPVDEIDTLGGFVISRVGRIPEEFEDLSIKYGGYVFDVIKVEDKRISLVKVYKEIQA